MDNDHWRVPPYWTREYLPVQKNVSSKVVSRSPSSTMMLETLASPLASRPIFGCRLFCMASKATFLSSNMVKVLAECTAVKEMFVIISGV